MVILRILAFLTLTGCLLVALLGNMAVVTCGEDQACADRFAVRALVVMLLLIASAVVCVFSLERPGRLALFGLVIPASITISYVALLE